MEQPHNDWVENRTKFHEANGMDKDAAYEKALAESESEGKKIAGMYADPQTGEVMKEETRKKIEREMKEKGTDKERPSSMH